jgi:hypothetical protein
LPRRTTSWIAALLTLALLFSQGLVAAYACTIGDGPAARLSGKVRMVEHMPNCSGMDDEQPAPANLCQSHCLPAQPAQQLDAPTAPIAPQPALIVQMATSVAVALHAPTDVFPAAAAPPPRLRFGRLLI